MQNNYSLHEAGQPRLGVSEFLDEYAIKQEEYRGDNTQLLYSKVSEERGMGSSRSGNQTSHMGNSHRDLQLMVMGLADPD